MSGCELLQLDSTPTLLHNLAHSSPPSAASAHTLNVIRRGFFFFNFIFLVGRSEDSIPRENDDGIREFASLSLPLWSHADTDLSGVGVGGSVEKRTRCSRSHVSVPGLNLQFSLCWRRTEEASAGRSSSTIPPTQHTIHNLPFMAHIAHILLLIIHQHPFLETPINPRHLLTSNSTGLPWRRTRKLQSSKLRTVSIEMPQL